MCYQEFKNIVKEKEAELSGSNHNLQSNSQKISLESIEAMYKDIESTLWIKEDNLDDTNTKVEEIEATQQTFKK